MEKLVGNARRADADLSKLGSTPLAQQAIKSIDTLANNIKQITDAQQRFADKAVAAATGIETLGGASRLMSRELDQVAKTINAGLDAFRALGQEAPKDLQRVADAVAKQQQALKAAATSTSELGAAQTKTGGLTSLLSEAQAGLFSVLSRVAGPAALGLAAKQALDYADNLTKLSDRTGIGVVALQRLGAIASASGNSLEDIAGAVNKFQRAIVEQTPAAVTAIKFLGLSIEDLRRQSPDEQFIAIAKALQQVHDPAQQAALAVELFGKSGAELLPTLKGDIDKLADSTVTMSAESVKALDDFGDALGHLKTSAVSIAGEILAAFLRTATGVKDAAKAILEAGARVTGGPAVTTPELLQNQPRFASSRVGAPQPRNITPELLPGVQLQLPGGLGGGSAAQALIGLPDVAAKAADALQRLHDRMRALEKAAQALGLETEDYEKKLAEVDAKIFAAERDTGHLTDTQEKAILRYRALGLSVGDVSIKLGLSEIAIKNFEDGLNATRERMAANTTETGKFQQELGKMIVGFDAAGKAVVGFHGVFRTDFDLPLEAAITDLSTITRATEIFAAEQKRTRDALQNQLAGTIGLPNVQPVHKDLLDAARETRDWRKDVDDLGRAFAQLAQVSDGGLAVVVKDIGNIISSFDLAIKSAHAFEQAETKAGKALALASGGAAVLQATGQGSTLSRTVGGALTGAQLGASIAPPGFQAIGAGIGAAAGGLIGFFRGLGNNPEKQINPLREAFVRASGGLAELNKKAFEATGSLALVQNLLNAKNADQFEAAMTALTTAFDAQKTRVDALAAAQAELVAVTKTDFGKMKEIADKYGISLSALGPAFESNRIHEAAGIIVNDFDTLQRGGADVDAVLAGMKKPINDLVNDAIKAGVALPKQFEPWVNQLALTGQLVDTNGDKITDTSTIKFADPVVTEFQKIVDKLQELIDKLGAPLTAAIKNIPKPDPIDVDVNVKYRFDRGNEFASTGGRITPTGIQHFAAGGRLLPFVSRGSDTVPFMGTPGEIILNEAQQSRVAAGLAGVGTDGGALRTQLAALSADLARRDRELPRLLARTVRDAVLLAS